MALPIKYIVGVAAALGCCGLFYSFMAGLQHDNANLAARLQRVDGELQRVKAEERVTLVLPPDAAGATKTAPAEPLTRPPEQAEQQLAATEDRKPLDTATRKADMEAEKAAATAAAENDIALIDRTFSADAVDSKWAPKARQLLLQEYSKLGSSVSVDCRTSLCKVELRGSNQSELLQGLQGAGQVWPAEHITRIGIDGAAVVYVAREGQPLPAMNDLRAESG